MRPRSRPVTHAPPAVCSPRPLPARRKNGAAGEAIADLEMEVGMCNITSRYSVQYLKESVARGPGDYFALLGRTVKMLSLISTFAARVYLDKFAGEEDSPVLVKRRAKELRELLTELGPSFIKAGQVLANRPDIMRSDYMEELTVLQDDVPPFADEEAFRIMEENLGRPLSEVFSSISERPIAAASIGQVYKAVLKGTGEQVAVKVQRPNVTTTIMRDLLIFRSLAWVINPLSLQQLGCNAELIVDEFGQKLLEELDYTLEAGNIEEFYNNFKDDPTVKIPWVRRDLCGPRMLVMEWIDGVRCTDPDLVKRTTNVEQFIRVGVVSGLRQLLEFGLFHGDPHPGNIFAMQDGRIAYVDFGNVAVLSQSNKQVLVDAVVHAVNEDYESMAGDFIQLGFLAQGTNISPIVPALEKIWQDSLGKSMNDFNFRTVTRKFNELVYQYPIRIPERYSLVIRSLLTQEGICLTLQPGFHFLEVAYPYVARRLLTDDDPVLRERLIQVLFQDGKFQWDRLENLISLTKDGGQEVDLTETAQQAGRLVVTDARLRSQLLNAMTEDNRLHVSEAMRILDLVRNDIDPQKMVRGVVSDFPRAGRQPLLAWADSVLAD